MKRRSTQKVLVETEWLSEKEMKDDYGWSQWKPQKYCMQCIYIVYDSQPVNLSESKLLELEQNRYIIPMSSQEAH